MAPNEQEQVTITVDGQEIRVPKGVLLVEAAKAVAVEIPVFCYHPKLEPVGMCRMCLVEVGNPGKNRDGTPMVDEAGKPVIQWFPKLMTACTTPVTEGMHVKTNNERVADAWRGTLEFLLTSHPLDCPVCDKGGECPLQDLTFAYGPDMSRFYKRNKYHFQKPTPLGELIWLDRERCIYCARCVRFQEEVAGDPVLKFADRNRGQEIVTYSEPPFDSYFSGNTTDICPVGALTTEDFRFKARVWELNNVPSVCNHCPVGCNVVLGVRTNEIKRVMPRANERVNEIWLCDKGRFGHHYIRSGERLTTPLLKNAQGGFDPVSWAQALKAVADGFAKALATRGVGMLGGIAGDHLPNEDLYLFARFMREVIGTNHVDFRLHWPVNTGIEEALSTVGLASGSNLGDLGKGAVILTVGANLEEEQPVSYLRVRGAVRRGAQLITIQSRATKESEEATQALTVKPGGEAHLAAALLKHVLGKPEADLGKLGGVDTLRAGVEALDAADLATQSGVEATTIEALAATLAGASSLVVMVGREALRNAGGNAPALVDALVALLVATGKAGQVNSGLVALWPHNNSQGAADMGVLPHLAAGYEAVATPGATVDQMLSEQVRLRALYLIGADPARDRPSSHALLNDLDFLVVQDLFMTDTARYANVILPAASHAERDGSFTNMERRVQRFERALEPVGEALPDWEIIKRVAALMDAQWPDYFTAHDIATEIAKKVKPYKGFTYDKLRGEAVPWTTTAAGHHIFTGTATMNTWHGLQWESAAEARRPKYDLHWHALSPVATPAEGELRLIIGRKLYDNGTLIRHSTLLDGRRARPVVHLNPLDAGALGVAEGEHLTVAAGGAQVTLPVLVDAGLTPGSLLLPFDTDGRELNALAETGVTVRATKAVGAFAVGD